MKRPGGWLGRTAQWCGVFVLVVASVPLIALTIIVLRGVLLAAVMAGIVGVIALYCIVPRFRHWTDHAVRPTRLHRVL